MKSPEKPETTLPSPVSQTPSEQPTWQKQRADRLTQNMADGLNKAVLEDQAERERAAKK